MPYKDPEKTKAYYKIYYQKNNAKLKAYGIAYGKRKRAEAKKVTNEEPVARCK